ncbi:uncharacterized protein GGS25DRAFT_365892 [Hypoxylon fragiforme]|uniref:uncharacterized protein n=1 Tax=Hypoxylon fragiforme TaxID=63214 RepID=UPI0020C670C0|nr:uncharacterized protein GGS25DRAFT_365892 [Hypoxylon fragiforme]KAI2605957.1 hypothetical protein GGS25DRAFT_365892 [Hypoxylon fragiforme]
MPVLCMYVCTYLDATLCTYIVGESMRWYKSPERDVRERRVPASERMQQSLYGRRDSRGRKSSIRLHRREVS